MTPDKNQKRIYVSLIISGALYVLLAFLVTRPLYLGIKNNSENFVAGKEKLILLENELKNLRESEKFYEANKEKLDEVDSLFISQEIPIEFMTFLENTADSSRLENKVSFVSAKGKETDPWPSLSFQITAAGALPDFLKFLEKLENSLYLIEILNLSVDRKEKVELSGIAQVGFLSDINATLAIKVFAK